jgi:hypothetical protein
MNSLGKDSLFQSCLINFFSGFLYFYLLKQFFRKVGLTNDIVFNQLLAAENGLYDILLLERRNSDDNFYLHLNDSNLKTFNLMDESGITNKSKKVDTDKDI